MTQSKKGRLLWLLPLAALIAFAAIACGGAPEEAAAPAPAAQAPAPAAPAPAAPAPAAPAAAPAPTTAPAMTTQDATTEQGGGTLTVVLDNVGSPLFRNEKGTFPDNMFNYYYGFQETLATWERTDDNSVNDATCEAPMLMTSWEYDLPPNFDDPDNQGTVTLKVREGVDTYIANGRHSELSAEDVAWSFNDAGSNNPKSTHSNAGEAGDWFKLWEATDAYTVTAHFRNYNADWINGGGAGISSMCGDTIGVVSKQLFDEIGDDILTTPHGTGPFYVQEWRPNELISATARVDHWNNNPNFAQLRLRQAGEAATRTALLQTNEADISMVSIQDVNTLTEAGFKFHEGLNQITGQFIYFAGNYWAFKDVQTDESVPLRDGFTPDVKHPWIGDPRLECVDADRTNTSVGAGCDATGFDYRDTDKFSYETESMQKALAFREALLFAIDRELIGETIVAGYGGPIYGGGHPGVHFHQLHKEWKDKWSLPFDVEMAKQRLADSGVEPGFSFEYYCPAGNGTSIEVCQAVAGMWEEHLGLKPTIENTAYSSRRPTMVGREINVVWQTSWGPNSNHAKQDIGGTLPQCCLWPIASAGGYNAGIEDNAYYHDFKTTSIQEKGSPENLMAREELTDRWYSRKVSGGIVEVPTLIGFNPERVESWDLKPWRATNSFDTVILINQ